MSTHRRGSRSWTEPEECDYVIKAILLGDLGVGKTSFLRSFLHGGCPSVPGTLRKGSQTGQASGHRVVMYDGKKVALTVWDTAGQERYRTLTASYYRGAHACIVMYDTHNEESFANVTMWIDSMLDYRDMTSAGTQTLLVGTVRKHSKAVPSSGCMVDGQRAQSLASHYQIPHFLVDSRQDPQAVQEVMDTVVTMVVARALDNQQLSQSITPYSTKLQQLAKKSRHSRCPPCCSI